MRNTSIAALMALTALAQAYPAAASDKDKEVTIANTPLPVTIINSSVPITLPAGQSVTISNSPTVQIAPDQKITIGNSRTESIPVVSLDATGAFQTQLNLTMNGTLPQASVTIPAGMRLVVEFFASNCSASSSGGNIQPVILLDSNINGVGAASFYMTPVQQPTFSDRFALSEQVKVYADQLTIGVGFAGFTPTFLACIVSISGHLVSLS
jgi:hypothetical protein